MKEKDWALSEILHAHLDPIIPFTNLLMYNQTFLLSSFFELVSSQEITLVYFFAPWCSWCKQFDPIAESVSLRIPIVKVDATKSLSLAGKFDVHSYPTLKLIVKVRMLLLLNLRINVVLSHLIYVTSSMLLSE